MGRGELTFLAHWHVATVDDRQNWEEIELAVVGSLNRLNWPMTRSAVELESTLRKVDGIRDQLSGL